MANKLQVKRTSVSGRSPNTTNSGNAQYIDAGELALNMADGILYTSNGSALIPVGANQANQRITNSLTFDNNKQLRFGTVNTSAYAYFIQQDDDNFVFYTTNTSYGARPVFSIYANSSTSDFQIGQPVRFNGANVTFQTSAALFANGSAGAAGQVLTSNGSAIYWAAVSGSGAINVNAQYVWSNLHTFQANVALTGNNLTLVSNTGSIMFAGAGDTNWRIGRSTGSTTKFYYTNNTLDIIAADSNLEGVVIGKPGGNTYLETGYAGTFTKNPIYVGNATVNVTINSTAFTGSSNNASFLGGTAAANFVQNTDSRTLSGNLVISGTYFNPSGNTILLGNSTQRWVLSATSGDFSTTVNAVTSVNSALLTVGTSFIANTTGLYHTGTINAASHTTTGITANATGVYPTSNTSGQNLGTATQRFDAFLDVVDVSGTINSNTGANAIILANQTSKWIYFTAGGAGAPTNTTRSDGTKIIIWPSLGGSSTDYAIGTDNNVLWYSVGQTTASHIWYANTTNFMTANISGLYHTGTINAASHTVGTSFTANSTVVNAVSYYAGTLLVANTTVVNATHLSGKTESNLNVNNALTANAASYLNSKAEADLNVNNALTSNNASYLNSKAEADLNVNNALTSNNASYLNGIIATSYVLENDTRNLTGDLTFTGSATVFNSNVTLNGVYANGSYGTAGQVLTSNGSKTYWSTVTGGSGSVNVNAQYTWTNVHTFQAQTNFANVSVVGIFANGSIGSNNQVLKSNGSVSYWSNNNFLTLSDAPSSYTGNAGSFVVVNPGETGLTFSSNIILSGIGFTSQAAPATPSADNIEMYMTSSGTSPNREVAVKFKNELGQEIILSSILV